MSASLAVGSVIRVQEPDRVRELGRVVWVEVGVNADRYAYLEYPGQQELKCGGLRRRNYIKREVIGSVTKLRESIDAGCVSLAMEVPRSERLLTDAELSGSNPGVGLIRPTRRNLHAWKAQRDEALDLIGPILKRYSPAQLFGEGLLDRAARKHAKALTGRSKRESDQYEGTCTRTNGQADESVPRLDQSGEPLDSIVLRIVQTVRRYFLHGAMPNALLPEYFNSGALGSTKFCKTRTGRPSKLGITRLPRTPTTLNKLQVGYRRHKKKGVSDEAAFIATLDDMWAANVVYLAHGEAKVTLLPEDQRPTLAEFVRAGRSLGMEMSPRRFSIGKVAFASEYRSRRGTSRDGIHAVGQVGVIDSTSEDYTPVSTASRLLLLPVPWRTMICDAYTEYIFGVHRGFEHGGTSAGLSALYHAQRDKLEWADEEEIHLEKGEWLSMAFLSVRGDHGDLKSERGIKTLSVSEMSLEITKSYTPQWKSIENVHQKMHVASDHKLPGTNFGETRSRGQKQDEEFLNFREGWPPLVRAIRYYNNHEPVPNLLTLAMRRAGVSPTRRAIVEYCLAEGLVASQPENLDYLRASCLPSLAAQGHRDRIEVWDPRVPKGRRKVPRMAYFGEFMNSEAWLSHPVKDIDIRMNTSRVGEAYANFNGLQTLKLLHHDHERHTVTLADWLFISDSDNLAQFLGAGQVQEEKASAHRSNQMGFAAAKAQKDAEMASAGRVSARRLRSSASKRAALEGEAEVLKQHAMGLSPPIPESPSPASPSSASQWLPATTSPAARDDEDAEMAELRARLK